MRASQCRRARFLCLVSTSLMVVAQLLVTSVIRLLTVVSILFNLVSNDVKEVLTCSDTNCWKLGGSVLIEVIVGSAELFSGSTRLDCCESCWTGGVCSKMGLGPNYAWGGRLRRIIGGLLILGMVLGSEINFVARLFM